MRSGTPVIQTMTTTEFAAAHDAKRDPDFPGIEAKMKAAAENAIKGLDPAKIDLKDAYDWAQLFRFAGRNKDVCDILHRFLATNPPADQKFNAEMLMMTSCNALGEADMLMSELKEVHPTDFAGGVNLVNQTAYMFADTIARHKTRWDAIKTIDAVEKAIPNQDNQAVAKTMLENDKKRHQDNPNLPANTKSDEELLKQFAATAQLQTDSAHFTLIQKKAELLNADGHKAEAVAALDDFVKTLAPDSALLKRVPLVKTQITLPGSVAPALAVERSYGNFPGLDALKGKVVVLDFFAHWCGPCIASFPEMRQMVADLKGQGLEVFGITTYYGYYGAEGAQQHDMPKDVEYGHMAEFMKEKNMTWPVVYGDRSNFAAYGVTGIPHVVLIDRHGVVHSLDIGYSKELFAKFRKEVEALLAEK